MKKAILFSTSLALLFVLYILIFNYDLNNLIVALLILLSQIVIYFENRNNESKKND